MKKEKISAEEMENILNKQSGVQAISGLVPDFRVIETACSSHEWCRLYHIYRWDWRKSN